MKKNVQSIFLFLSCFSNLNIFSYYQSDKLQNKKISYSISCSFLSNPFFQKPSLKIYHHGKNLYYEDGTFIFEIDENLKKIDILIGSIEQPKHNTTKYLTITNGSKYKLFTLSKNKFIDENGLHKIKWGIEIKESFHRKHLDQNSVIIFANPDLIETFNLNISTERSHALNIGTLVFKEDKKIDKKLVYETLASLDTAQFHEKDNISKLQNREKVNV